MELTLLIQVVIMGIVEGLTEFLPISSTGHLILAGSLLNFTGEKVKVFEIVIQAGAMLAVCWEYRVKIARVILDFRSDIAARRFVVNLMVAFLPAVVLGLAFGKAIKAHLFKPIPVALAFIIGGFVIIVIEKRHRRVMYSRVDAVDDMSVVDALKVGLAQCFALIPGTSRSLATILGGRVAGLSHAASTEFSFLVGLLTLSAASVYKMWSLGPALTQVYPAGPAGVGLLVAAVTAFVSVKWLVGYVSRHGLGVFAWYRIALGGAILAFLALS